MDSFAAFRDLPLVPPDACTPDLTRGRTLLADRLGFDPLAEDSENLKTSSRPSPVSVVRQPTRRLIGPLTVLCGIGATVLAFVFFARPTPPGASVPRTSADLPVYTTTAGQRASVQLANGTNVVLGPSSTLSLTRSESNTTELRLEGRAYFEVAPREGAVFSIHANGALVDVLGTAFSVDADPATRDVEVVVASGKVSLRVRAATTVPAVLTSGSMGRMTGDRVTFDHNVNVGQRLAWTAGRLVFDDVPVPEMLRELERWYGVQFQAAPGLAHRLSAQAPNVTATFYTTESADATVRGVALMLGMRAERRGSMVILSGE